MIASKWLTGLCAAAALALACGSASAAPLTGTYDTGDGSDGNATTPLNATGPWTMTGSSTAFSYLLRYVNENVTFSQLTDLNTVFIVNSGEAGGGSPRLRVLLDVDGSGDISAGDGSLSIYLGDSPSYTSNLADYIGFNVIGNNDAGRYDASAPALGGSPSTTYSAVNASYGSLRVLRLGLVLDGFGPFGQQIEVSSINAAAPAAVPLPAAAWTGLSLLGAIAVSKRLRARKA